MDYPPRRVSRMTEKAKPSERGLKFATELLNISISGGTEEERKEYVACLFDAYAGKIEDEAVSDPDYCNECGMIYYNCLCGHDEKLIEIERRAKQLQHERE